MYLRRSHDFLTQIKAQWEKGAVVNRDAQSDENALVDSVTHVMGSYMNWLYKQQAVHAEQCNLPIIPRTHREQPTDASQWDVSFQEWHKATTACGWACNLHNFANLDRLPNLSHPRKHSRDDIPGRSITLSWNSETCGQDIGRKLLAFILALRASNGESEQITQALTAPVYYSHDANDAKSDAGLDSGWGVLLASLWERAAPRLPLQTTPRTTPVYTIVEVVIRDPVICLRGKDTKAVSLLRLQLSDAYKNDPHLKHSLFETSNRKAKRARFSYTESSCEVYRCSDRTPKSLTVLHTLEYCAVAPITVK